MDFAQFSSDKLEFYWKYPLFCETTPKLADPPQIYSKICDSSMIFLDNY